MSINKVILIGYVGLDPDVRYFEGGNAVASVRLATSDRAYTLPNGTQVPERTEWHNLVFRGKLAQIVETYVHKGDRLYVEGRIRTRSYTDKAGITRYATEIYVDQMEMLSPNPASSAQPADAPAKPATGVQPQFGYGKEEEDRPF